MKATATYMYPRSISSSSSSQFNFMYLVNHLNVYMEVSCLRLVDSFFFLIVKKIHVWEGSSYLENLELNTGSVNLTWFSL